VSNLPAAQRARLAARNAEHQTVEWLQVADEDLRELAAGRVSEMVQRNAAWACETLDAMLERKAGERRARGGA
jgi:hypothetical protein